MGNKKEERVSTKEKEKIMKIIIIRAWVKAISEVICEDLDGLDEEDKRGA